MAHTSHRIYIPCVHASAVELMMTPNAEPCNSSIILVVFIFPGFYFPFSHQTKLQEHRIFFGLCHWMSEISLCGRRGDENEENLRWNNNMTWDSIRSEIKRLLLRKHSIFEETEKIVRAPPKMVHRWWTSQTIETASVCAASCWLSFTFLVVKYGHIDVTWMS